MDAATGAASDAAEGAANLAEDATEAAGDAVDTTTEAAGDAAEAAGDAVDATTEAASDTAAAVEEGAEAAAEATAEPALEPTPEVEAALTADGFDADAIRDAIESSDMSQTNKLMARTLIDQAADNPANLESILGDLRGLLGLE